MLAVQCMPDHAHIFVGFKPTLYIPDFVKEIKVESNEFIASKNWVGTRFAWQEGYGAFSIGISGLDETVIYIRAQEEHLRTRTYREEVEFFLRRHGREA